MAPATTRDPSIWPCHSQFVLGHSSTHEPCQSIARSTHAARGPAHPALPTHSRVCVTRHSPNPGWPHQMVWFGHHPPHPRARGGKKTEKRRLVRARPRVTRRETSRSLISAKAGAGEREGDSCSFVLDSFVPRSNRPSPFAHSLASYWSTHSPHPSFDGGGAITTT
jgi:hypothetical protein